MKYLITLKPLGSYFFGGEVTFGETGAAQNYLVKSNVLPQASAVLGLVRYCILRRNGLLSYDRKDAGTVEKLIGPKGFDFDDRPDYGIIKGVSPVFITDGRDFYTPVPLDSGMQIVFDDNNRCSFSSSVEKKLPVIEKYDSKKYDAYKYWCDTEGRIFKEDLFTFVSQVGITKNGRKETEKDAFFKQTTVILNSKMSFAFTVELDDRKLSNENYKTDLKSESTVVPFGGNRSMFLMTVTDGESINWSDKFKALSKDNRLLLLGDAVIKKEEREECLFIWGENKPFRYMVNAAKEGHSWNKPNKKEVLLHLQSRGSVIYADSDTLEKIRNDAEASLTAIGLNIFI